MPIDRDSNIANKPPGKSVSYASSATHTPYMFNQAATHFPTEISRKRSTRFCFDFSVLTQIGNLCNLVDTEGSRNTHRSDHQKEVTLTRLFQRNGLENFSQTCYNLSRMDPSEYLLRFARVDPKEVFYHNTPDFPTFLSPNTLHKTTHEKMGVSDAVTHLHSYFKL